MLRLGASFIATIAIALLLSFVTSTSVLAQPVHEDLKPVSFETHLLGATEVPPVDSPVSALAHLQFDPSSKMLHYDLTVSGASENLITAAHIHRGKAGVNGPVLYPLAAKGFTQISGDVTLTDADVEDLYSGGLYVNVHSVDHPNGAARGQILLPGETGASPITMTTDSYRLDLLVNPAETMLMPDMVGNATTGEVMVQMPGMAMPAMSMTDQGMPDNHHVEVHVFNKDTGAVVKDMMPIITLTNEATGATRTLGMANIMAMYGLDVGVSDFHFGNNVYLPDGAYRVSVAVGGQTAVFPHVDVGASEMSMGGMAPAMNGMAPAMGGTAPAFTPPNTGDAGLASPRRVSELLLLVGMLVSVGCLLSLGRRHT